MLRRFLAISALFGAVFSIAGCGCRSSATNPVFSIPAGRVVLSNIAYDTVGGRPLFLDAYLPASQLGQDPWVQFPTDPRPTLLYFHGGGWSEGDRISRSLLLLPYLEKGWCVVTADYRLLGPTNLLDCIRDCRAALRWVYGQAGKYPFDTARIVVSGESAGAHLALMTGLTADDPQFAVDSVPSGRPLRVAAVINWFGISDVEKAVRFWNSDAYTRQIVGSSPSAAGLLKLASPVQHVRPGSPPVLSVHGELDVNVPISQSEALHTALDRHGVRNELIRIPEKKHGNFSAEEFAQAFERIWQFVR
ncbi:alpha/beta hydrolase [Larkinella soli]|uniref:alpha/beta hydrolase n=1 Tax=Larkinella soli TaxID=1770527 RepID=UPI000FFC6F7C|nr:alpha/beta hydrolase [Larkinella soli]